MAAPTTELQYKQYEQHLKDFAEALSIKVPRGQRLIIENRRSQKYRIL